MVNPRRAHCAEIYQSDAYCNYEHYYYDYVGNKSAYQEGFRSKPAYISRYCAARRKLLDVGAAYGFFMEEATKRGFEAYGVELSRSVAQHAAQYAEVFLMPLSVMETELRFSAITFIDSLENFEDPTGVLRKALELLEDDGVVAVMVPILLYI